MSAEVLSKPLHLFAVEPRAAYGFRALGNFHLFGNKYIEVPNEPDALIINYYLRAKADGEAGATVFDIKGDRVAQIKGPAEAGLNRLSWNMRRGSPSTGSGQGPSTGSGQAASVGRDAARRVSRRAEAGGQQQTTIARIRERIQ